ncbi:MAG: CBS domain-containing protein [Burkholderiaceae bacterium]|jgi:magnesium and cobalt transporter|nr:CBS domain-containing protein [Burkholderiaceae bacterium]
MPDQTENTLSDTEQHRTLFDRIAALVSPEPENRKELLSVLHDAHQRNLIDAESLSMIEGVFRMTELSARDLMVPRSRMHVIDVSTPVGEWLSRAVESGHSRFPAVDGDIENVVGVILAKDLLSYSAGHPFEIGKIIRPAVFIPESKRLNILLREFRHNYNHMAIVIDEYGGIAGLITIEDVLEQIVGDIEDEYDEDDGEEDIRVIRSGNRVRWRVSALTELSAFNKEIGVSLDTGGAETIGGYLTDVIGKVPQTGDSIDTDGLHFVVFRADTRQIHVLLVEKLLTRPDQAI